MGLPRSATQRVRKISLLDLPDCLCLFILGGNGGPNRDRTDDLLHAMQALSQLSYGPLPEFVKELMFKAELDNTESWTEFQAKKKGLKKIRPFLMFFVLNKRSPISF